MSALHLQTSMPRAPPDPGVAPLGFDALYREHFRFVWTNLLRLGVPRHGVEDAVQETFLVVHRRLDDFEGRGSPRAWLFGILRRVAFRSRRTRDRTQRKVSALSQHRPSVASLDDELARAQLSALLLEALDELDDDKRAALTLHVFDELSGPEVAGMLGLKVDTAYSRIKAGRKALQRVLATKGVDADVARLVRATRDQTLPAPGSRKRVAAMLLGPLTAAAPTASPWWPALASPKAVLVAAVLSTGAVFGVAQLSSRGPGPASVPQRVAAASASDASAPPTTGHAPAARSPAIPAARSPAIPATAAAAEGTPSPAVRRPSPLPLPAPAVRADEAPDASHAAIRQANDPAAMALQAEVKLIGKATTALREDRPRDALRALSEHATRFPQGQLATERRGYRAIALCTDGNARQGRAEARQILASTPPKALRARVEAACGETPAL